MPKKPPNGLDSGENPTEEELKKIVENTEEKKGTSDENE